MDALLSCTAQQMGQVDAVITEELFDHPGIISHKMVIATMPLKPEEVKSHPLYSLFYEAYKGAMLSVVIRPLPFNFSRDKCTSFGVFAGVFLPYGEIVTSLFGFLADFTGEEEDGSDNFFSVYHTKRGDKVMLGGVSFINSCCVPNVEFVPNLKAMTIEVRVICPSGIKVGTQLTAQYNRKYFELDGTGCECEYTENHVGGSVEVPGCTRSMTRQIRSIAWCVTNLSLIVFCNLLHILNIVYALGNRLQQPLIDTMTVQPIKCPPEPLCLLAVFPFVTSHSKLEQTCKSK